MSLLFVDINREFTKSKLIGKLHSFLVNAPELHSGVVAVLVIFPITFISLDKSFHALASPLCFFFGPSLDNIHVSKNMLISLLLLNAVFRDKSSDGAPFLSAVPSSSLKSTCLGSKQKTTMKKGFMCIN